MEQKENVQQAKTKKRLVIFLFLSLIIGFGVVLAFNQQKKLPSNGTGISGYVIGEGIEPNLTPEQIQEMLDREVDASKISFSIYSEPIFNGKVGKVMFANPPYSAHDIDLTITLDGKEIVKTGKISPNQYIEDIELLGKELEKGEYVGTGLITAYNQETGEKVGQAAVEMHITAE